jgi:hypothetical protein
VKTVILDSGSLDRDLNPVSPEYEGEGLTARPRCLFLTMFEIADSVRSRHFDADYTLTAGSIRILNYVVGKRAYYSSYFVILFSFRCATLFFWMLLVLILCHKAGYLA